MSEQQSMGQREFWSGRRVLVTGATGFLGGALVENLRASNAHVVMIVRDLPHTAAVLQRQPSSGVDLVGGDICDAKLVRRVLNEYEVLTVFHLAAQSLVGVGLKDPVTTFETNIAGTWNVLDSCRSSSVEQVVVASSDKAYGHAMRLPYTEDHPLQGRAPYDVSKSCADLIAQSYAWTYGLPVGIARCANIYGGGDVNFKRLIPGAIQSVLHGQRPLIRSDGSAIRDYLHVSDAVSAYLSFAEGIARSQGSLNGRALNFSADQPSSVMDVVNTILEACNVDIEPEVQNTATHEIDAQHLSAQTANDLLGWRAALDLRSGINEAVQWYTSYFQRNSQTEAPPASLRVRTRVPGVPRWPRLESVL